MSRSLKKIKKAFQEGAAIKIDNKEIMIIYNNIYQLSNQVHQEVETAQVNRRLYSPNYKIVDQQLIEIYIDLLKEFINDICYQVDKFKQEKESVLFIVTKTYHNYKAYSYWLQKIFYYFDNNFTSYS
ncbi:unnamed protein product [Paramecium primaurelia]|uniref:Uncharacterized protein n=1 Tax=Paramecium primaurelia TaxID=5886 RepID=A0A8S1QLA1_PARPR|nr:unnamed protein product [Paramecium primaurelia]